MTYFKQIHFSKYYLLRFRNTAMPLPVMVSNVFAKAENCFFELRILRNCAHCRTNVLPKDHLPLFRLFSNEAFFQKKECLANYRVFLNRFQGFSEVRRYR